jgi:hypothetical protein
LNIPGAVGSQPVDINNAGQIVGTYFSAPSTLNGNGFVYAGGTFPEQPARI